MEARDLKKEIHQFTMTHRYSVKGMTCKSCVAKVESVLRVVPEITEVKVTLAPAEALISMSSHVSIAHLNSKLAAVGDYQLAEESSDTSGKGEVSVSSLKSYFPLILIALYLIGGVVAREVSLARFDLHAMMTNFMGGFFVIFSFFKLLDLKGFAEGYSTYDLIAARFRDYGFIYPFLELGLGILYLVGSAPVTTNILTAILMAVSSIGVLKTIRENRPFQCACLGTIFKLPLTKITLAEDLLMLVMALVMLIIPAAY